MNIIVQTARLIVREFLPKESNLLIELYRDKMVTKYEVQLSVEETIEKFETILLDYKNALGLARWGIFNRSDNSFVGMCKLKPADSDLSKIEFGILLMHQYWGIGLAKEVTKALIDYGFNQRGLIEICACVHPENNASHKLLQNVGFVKDGNVFWNESELPFYRKVK